MPMALHPSWVQSKKTYHVVQSSEPASGSSPGSWTATNGNGSSNVGMYEGAASGPDTPSLTPNRTSGSWYVSTKLVPTCAATVASGHGGSPASPLLVEVWILERVAAGGPIPSCPVGPRCRRL